MAQHEEQITTLLKAWQEGNAEAKDELFHLVYQELRQIARKRLKSEGSPHTLQATELVHEVFPQLARQRQPWQNRSQFFALASECMRRYLVDYARTRRRQKRGGDNYQISFSAVNPTEICRIENFDEILAVDQALKKLKTIDSTQALIIKHRYFGGLDREEIAGILQVSPSTVDRGYRLAKAWLKRELAFQFSPYFLHSIHILRPPIFIEQFSIGSDNFFAGYLRSFLPPELIKKVDQLKSGATIAFNLLPELIESLNKLLLGNPIFPPDLLKRFEPNLPKNNSLAEENLRSNRFLLEKAFPGEFTSVF